MVLFPEGWQRLGVRDTNSKSSCTTSQKSLSQLFKVSHRSDFYCLAQHGASNGVLDLVAFMLQPTKEPEIEKLTDLDGHLATHYRFYNDINNFLTR